ncbi:unnamed protein product [Arctogadus glacialis]
MLPPPLVALPPLLCHPAPPPDTVPVKVSPPADFHNIQCAGFYFYFYLTNVTLQMSPVPLFFFKHDNPQITDNVIDSTKLFTILVSIKMSNFHQDFAECALYSLLFLLLALVVSPSLMDPREELY